MFGKRVKNHIEIDLSTIASPTREFIKDTIKQANRLGVSVHLLDSRKVRYTDHDGDDAGYSNGYFCDESMVLAVACQQDFDNWLRVFVHESSHMDQWHEDDPYWDTVEFCGIDSGSVLDLWLKHYVEATPEQMTKIVKPSVDVELDCERRTIKKIIKHNLPLCPKRYAKLANSYVWLYIVMPYLRKWYDIGKEPWNIDAIVDFMPEHLNMNYEEVPKEIIKLYKQNML